MANRGFSEFLKDSNGDKLNAVQKTATFNTKGYKVGGLDMIGIILDVNTVAAGTLDIKMQRSMDGGSTWLDTYAAVENDETQAVMAQVTAAIETEKHWPVWPAAIGIDGEVPQVRWVFTMATTPDMTFTAYVEGRGYGGGG